MFGLAFDYLIMALAPNIAWLFVGRVISGITASSGSAAGRLRGRRLDAGGPRPQLRPLPGRRQRRDPAGAGAGRLRRRAGPARAVLGGGGAWRFANGLYGYFVVPESLSHERRAPFRWRRANPIGAAALLVSHKGLLGLAMILFIAQFAGASFNSIFQFYTHFRFGWGPPQVAVLLMVLCGRQHR